MNLKTHSRTTLTNDFKDLETCKVHGVKPEVIEIIAGRSKDSHFMVTCGSDKCTKLTMDNPQTAVDAWNKTQKAV